MVERTDNLIVVRRRNRVKMVEPSFKKNSTGQSSQS